MGVSGITVKKLEKLSSDQESRQVCFEDMTNNDLWLAADILLSLGDEALKTCISNYHECSFGVHRESINLLEINTLKPFQAPSPKPCIWGRSVRGETSEGGFLKSSCAHLHETAIDRVNAGLKLHQSPEQQCTIWQILVGVKVRHFSGCRFVHRPARRSAPTEQRSCAGLWSNRGAVFAL